MTDGWVETTLGDCYKYVADRFASQSLHPDETYFGLEHLEPESPLAVNGGTVSQVSGQVFAFTEADTLFGRLRAYLRKVSFAASDGYCSTEILVLRPRSDIVAPRFLHLLASSDSVIAQAVASGAGSRMPRTSERDLSSITVLLPPLAVQRRIVDVMEHLDNQIQELRREAAMVRTLLTARREELARHDDYPLVPLGDHLTHIQAGKSPSGEDRTPRDGERAVLKVSAVGSEGFDPTQVKVIPASFDISEELAVGEGDVLLVRANGVLDRVGQVCRVREPVSNLYLCDKTLRLTPSPTLDSDYLTHTMSTSLAREQIASLTGGSDMRNISQKSIRQIKLPFPDLSDQREWSSEFNALQDTAARLDNEAMGLSELRRVTLSLLLSGEHDIPASYDDLLEVTS